MTPDPFPTAALSLVPKLRELLPLLPPPEKWTLSPSFGLRSDGRCPLGFHPQARYKTPQHLREFGGINWNAAWAVIDWWDRQTDAAYALGEIRRVCEEGT